MKIETKDVQTILEWTKDQVYIHATTNSGTHARPKRGQVFRCKFGVGVGSELQKIRPAVVISEHINNQNSEIIVVAPITHTNKNIPCIIAITPKMDANGNQILDGCVNVSAMRSLSSYRLSGYICDLSKTELNNVDTAIARHLDLLHHYSKGQRIIKDKDNHINSLTVILDKLRDLTQTTNNRALLEQMEAFIRNGGQLATPDSTPNSDIK